MEELINLGISLTTINSMYELNPETNRYRVGISHSGYN